MSNARTPLVAGNWKCNKTIPEAVELATHVRNAARVLREVEIVVAPPFVALSAVAKRLEGSVVGLSGQDIHWEDSGAFTGAISGPMLSDVGCQFVIVGHSERRQVFGETDAVVRKKLTAALRNQLKTILCIGETLEERDSGQAMSRLEAQLAAALTEIAPTTAEQVIVAYEPVWAIGTGRNATPEQAEEAHRHIRSELSRRFGSAAERMRILYGGSVKPDNAQQLLGQPNVDGALVGGASLDAQTFLAIAKSARS